MCDCKTFGKFPKRYLYPVKKGNSTFQLFVSEETHQQLQELKQKHPEAELTIKDETNE